MPRERDTALSSRGQPLVKRSPSRERVYPAGCLPRLPDRLSQLCSARAVPRTRGHRQSRSSRQCCSSAPASACRCGANPRRSWADAVGRRGRSSTSPHLDGSLASAIRGDPSFDSHPAAGGASSTPTAGDPFPAPLELAGPARPQCWLGTTAPAGHCRWRSRFSGDAVTPEKPDHQRSLFNGVSDPSEQIRRAEIVCLLPAKPAALLSWLADDLIEIAPTKP